MPYIPPGSYVQNSADNVDHNSRTLDGKNTFHGMGIIACVTPSVVPSNTQITLNCKNYQLRYKKYIDLAAKGIVDPSKLPPTDSAAYQHTLRAVYQATVWDKLDEFCLDPCQYGWDLVDSFHSPVANSQSCAPDNLLKLVRCKCKSGCQSALCSCRKHGLSCAVACQNCRGTCENSQVA